MSKAKKLGLQSRTRRRAGTKTKVTGKKSGNKLPKNRFPERTKYHRRKPKS